ncbi:MAG TPA: ATP-binding protein [Anaerolineae bacterium]|nr:ATP-binding protein [Anaerolineae bacterium]
MATTKLMIDLAKLAQVRSFVLRTGRDLGLEAEAIDALLLAVEEACSNVCRHAYGGECGQIELTIVSGDGAVEVVLRDWGAAFDPLAVPIPDVTAPLEERSLGGLGVYLMRKLMDQVDFEFDGESGNTLTMVKRLDQS